MYFYLAQALKRRLILELKDSFSKHPIYEKIVPFIQNKYAFTERPQFGIVVKGSSANKVSLAADNFLGTIESHVMLAFVGEAAYPIEWIREDLAAVQANNDKMPIPSGIYYLEVLSVPTTAQGQGMFAIDPLIEVTDEAVLVFATGIEQEAQLQQRPTKGTLRLWENRRFLLTEGTHFTVDYLTGAIELLQRFSPNSILTADYFYPADSIGPVPFVWNTADFKTLPGIVMAFGKRARVGDKIAIRVYPDRVEAANAIGGRFDLSFEFDVIAQDSIQMEEIADLIIMYLWGQKRPVLSSEGIELTDISMGGESEETYDETADTYYYNASMTAQLQADWEIHIPLPLTISRVVANTKQQDLTTTPTSLDTGTTIIGDVKSKLFFATNPVLAGRNSAFERIR
jgi:hypothetical protein